MTVVSAAIDRVMGFVILCMEAAYQMGWHTATSHPDWPPLLHWPALFLHVSTLQKPQEQADL